MRTFGTVTRELLRLADWLGEERASCVVIEGIADPDLLNWWPDRRADPWG